MKYRAEIDGLRAVAVVPVILFHSGLGVFSGGYVGVDVFFVISGYLITTILMEDIANQRFSVGRFYARRARRLLPALFFMLLISTIMAYAILYPTDLEEYGNSLLATLFFISNHHFQHSNDYFAVDTELVPLIHTWSLAVEEQYYIFFPLLLVLLWKLGRNRALAVIILLSCASLALSEWGWRNDPDANFYHITTRAWELFAGSIAAFVIRKDGVRSSTVLSGCGLAAICFAFLAYDQQTPFPSLYALAPVLGTTLIILYAGPGTLVRTVLSTRPFVAIGLISYSAYLWHQPLMAFYRWETGISLSLPEIAGLFVLTLLLAYGSWRFIETPFRHGGSLANTRMLWPSLGAFTVLTAFSAGLVLSNGASYRFDFPPKPEPWADIACHGVFESSDKTDRLLECLGDGRAPQSGNIYLIGESHAAQLTFAIRAVAEDRGVNFHFINTEDRSEYPHAFWNRPVTADRILDHVLAVAKPGDILATSFHRGHFNAERDVHIPLAHPVEPSERSRQYHENISPYLERLQGRGITVYFVKDGPLLFDADTSLEKCMYEFSNGVPDPCAITLEQDMHTRTLQSDVFDDLARRFDFAHALDYLPVLYSDDLFSPISEAGQYLMFDRHHLTETASLKLVEFFARTLVPTADVDDGAVAAD